MELKDIESAIEEIQAIKTSKAQIDILWKIGNPKSEMYDILYKIESTKMQEAIKKTLATLEAAKVKKNQKFDLEIETIRQSLRSTLLSTLNKTC